VEEKTMDGIKIFLLCNHAGKKRNIGYLLKLPNSFKTLNVLTHAEEWYFI